MKQKHTLRLILFAFLAIGSRAPAQSQEQEPASKDRIAWAHDFMRALYPDLGGSRTLTVETYLPYAQADTTIRWLEVSIGEGPKDAILGYAGGCLNEPVVPSPPPWPAELGPPPPPLPAAPNASVSASLTDRKPSDCPAGPTHPKQLLSGTFWFSTDGRLTTYAVGNPRNLGKMNVFAGLVLSQPEMTDSEVIAGLKKSGAKYGPLDKNEFIGSLPIAALEPFLGKLQVLNVDFQPLFKSRNNVATWPEWKVTAKATPEGKTEEMYEMQFDQFNGDLISLRLIAPGVAARAKR
jgi:hypothetical protein